MASRVRRKVFAYLPFVVLALAALVAAYHVAAYW